jgi:cytochrome c553
VIWSNAVRARNMPRTADEMMDASRRVTIRRLLAALLATALTAAFAGAARADDFEAKLGYCKDCHGPSAQGYRGYMPIPRLAGQQPQYLENQLRAFIEHRRTNNVMFNVAHALKPGMVTALAESFHKLDPPPIGGGPRGLVAAGKNIFEDGVPDSNIAACAACHGPEATGIGEIPRLAGQLYPYVIKELTNWGKERGQNPAIRDTSAIMSPVAHSLSKPQIEAVAAFVSQLR